MTAIIKDRMRILAIGNGIMDALEQCKKVQGKLPETILPLHEHEDGYHGTTYITDSLKHIRRAGKTTDISWECRDKILKICQFYVNMKPSDLRLNLSDGLNPEPFMYYMKKINVKGKPRIQWRLLTDEPFSKTKVYYDFLFKYSAIDKVRQQARMLYINGGLLPQNRERDILVMP